MHACTNPLDALRYYNIKYGSKYHLVECSGTIDDGHFQKDSKIACTRMSILEELTLQEIVNAGIAALMKNAMLDENSNSYDYVHGVTGDDCQAVTPANKSCISVASGDHSSAMVLAPDSASLAGGDMPTSISNEKGSLSATIGEFGISTSAGEKSMCVGYGDYSTCISLENESLNALLGSDSASVACGNNSINVVSGSNSVAEVRGNDSIAVADGAGTKAKGALGCYLVLTEYLGGKLINCKSRKVDGRHIKANTYYKLHDGKFEESK